MDGEAVYYGLNALSHNVIMANRKKLKNPNGLFLGVPGSGKSFAAKRELVNVFLATKDRIIVVDPMGEYAPLVEWLGYVFRPLFLLFGFRGEELAVASTGAVISLVEVTVPALLVAVGSWSMRLRFMLAVLPVSSIIFLASFVPCLMATDVPVKFSHILLVWLERMILSILIAGLFAVLLFPAGMAA